MTQSHSHILNAMVLNAPAKINLFLHITSKRPNGYHEMDMLVCFASIGDELHIRRTEGKGIDLSVSGPFASGVPTDDHNLISVTLRRMARYLNIETALSIHLIKNLPPAAGIGGGSADAAAALRGFQTLYDLDLKAPVAQDVMLEIGADIPMCFRSVTAHLQGVGEEIIPTKIDLKDKGIVLVNAGEPISTVDVFRGYKGSFQKPLSSIEDIDFLSQTTNDLLPAAMELSPVIYDVLKVCQKAEGLIHSGMSGSGGTCFALTDNIEQAGKLKEIILKEYPEWWVESGFIL